MPRVAHVACDRKRATRRGLPTFLKIPAWLTFSSGDALGHLYRPAEEGGYSAGYHSRETRRNDRRMQGCARSCRRPNLAGSPMAWRKPFFPKCHDTPNVDDQRILSGLIVSGPNDLRSEVTFVTALRKNGSHRPKNVELPDRIPSCRSARCRPAGECSKTHQSMNHDASACVAPSTMIEKSATPSPLTSPWIICEVP